MEIQFWYSDILPNTNIRNSIEKIDNSILFNNIDTNTIDTTKLNFLVFLLENEWTVPHNKNTAHTHSIEFIALLTKLQSKNFYFIADGGEAELFKDEVFSKFLNILNNNKFDINKLIVINNDFSKVGFHKIKYDKFVLNTLFFPHFFLATYDNLNKYIKDIVTNNKTIPNKKFLCLNRRMTDKKYKIIEELYNRRLLNDTRFTWIKNFVSTDNINKELILEYNINVNDFKSIQLEDDVSYTTDVIMQEKNLHIINPNWYYQSKVNIISETMLYDNRIHITEKTWKPIYLGIPFVIYAPSKHYLKTLRDMGFKTFNSVINEDYDEMNGKDKIKKIIDSALQLSNVYNSKEVLDICKFNQKLYFDFDYRKQIYKEFFLNKLCDVQNLTIPKTLI